MSNLLEEWKKKKRATMGAEAWNNLPVGPKYQGGSFKISLAHCVEPKLVRAGQQSCGGQNYWESPAEMNAAILSYLVANWESVWPGVRKILADAEKAALLACQSHVDEIQGAINAAHENQQ